MNDNNNNVGHNPSENDGDSIGDIDVDDIPTLYNKIGQRARKFFKERLRKTIENTNNGTPIILPTPY